MKVLLVGPCPELWQARLPSFWRRSPTSLTRGVAVSLGLKGSHRSNHQNDCKNQADVNDDCNHNGNSNNSNNNNHHEEFYVS